ncbi:MAG: TetR/AcrR family transcriptional regulator [Pseudomonadota bacterium]
MPKDTKSALLDFAEHAARAHGWDGFSYADLADAVGIRKASVHYHFPTKSHLSVALMERYTSEMQSTCHTIDQSCKTAAQKLEAIIDHYRKALNSGQTVCLCVSFSVSRESLSDEVIARIEVFREMMIDWLTSVFDLGKADHSISRANDAKREALATLAILEGAHLAARTSCDVARFDGAVEIIEHRCT